MTSGSAFDYAPGRQIGHEVAGEVIEIGRGVTSLGMGDRVAIMPVGACGTCANCREDRPLHCLNKKRLGAGFSERMVVPARSALRMPESLSFADGALVEPMACGRKALRVAGIHKGDTVLVLGAGSMALSLVYWARLQGAARIVVASRSAKRDEIVMAMGADATVRLGDEDPAAILQTLQRPPDIVAECVGKPGLLQRAVELAKPGGQVLSMGMCSAPDTIVPAFGSFREVSIHCPLAYSRTDLMETIHAFDNGSARPDAMVSTTIGLLELPAMIEHMRGPHDHMKVQVAPGSD
jgi:(R,R)-butanediol dehydrogenase/meso-butanediol dehydrogenase/diacetyl reductase